MKKSRRKGFYPKLPGELVEIDREGFIHYFNYPHHPQSNGHLERFNRTIQEQFAAYHADLIDEPEEFNRPLME